MKLKKENSMLIDIQYIKANKKEGHLDYLYIIWKNLDTNEKHLEIIPEPMMDIYFEKMEYRNHLYNKTYQKLECLDKKTVKYRDIIYSIVDDMGDEGRQRLNNLMVSGNYKAISEFYMYPYVYGADYDIRAWYRYKWLEQLDNDRVKPISKGFLDIEVDSFEAPGMADPVFCPVDLVTVIDFDDNISYTFALIGVDCVEKDITRMNSEDSDKEIKRREMYDHRMEEQEYWSTHIDELTEKAHDMFDENYPNMEYKFYFYKDEKKMLTHLFQLINNLKKDFIGIWNIAFDIPYLIERMEVLGMDPAKVMCHPDFPIKKCYFKKDNINFQVKNKSDFFNLSSYTIFFDQMRNYAAIRKGQQELRSYKLSYIAQKELQDDKLDYSEVGNIKTLSYVNYLMYILYNIKDVLLQVGIEKRTNDVDTYYLTSYVNMTPYEDEFKQTVKLRNVQYKSFLMNQGLVPGENINKFLNIGNAVEESDDDDEDDESSDKKTKFEGALVGDPTLISNFGVELFGKKSNSVFKYSIDMDMSRFYPSCIAAMNIEPSCLIFKAIIDPSQYDVRGGNIPFNGITDVQVNEKNNDSFADDIAKEVFDNFQTRNYLSIGHKWLNLPSVNEVYEKLKEELD